MDVVACAKCRVLAVGLAVGLALHAWLTRLITVSPARGCQSSTVQYVGNLAQHRPRLFSLSQLFTSMAVCHPVFPSLATSTVELTHT